MTYRTFLLSGLHPALIAAIASRESRGGARLRADGRGMDDPNGYGLMQVLYLQQFKRYRVGVIFSI